MKFVRFISISFFFCLCTSCSREDDAAFLDPLTDKAGIDTLYISETDYFFGEFENGKTNGIGKTYFESGDSYIGQWKNGKWSGTGEAHWGEGQWSGDHCIGTFENFEMNGFCIYTHGDGTITQGNYINGKLNGIGYRKWGTNEWAGDYYLGEWKNGKRTGLAFYFDASEDTLVEGRFDNGTYFEHVDIGFNDSTIWASDIENEFELLLKKMDSVQTRFNEIEASVVKN